MAPNKKHSSIKKKAKGIGLGVGLSALAAFAYKQGLFDKLAEQIKGNTVVSQEGPELEDVPAPHKPVKRKIQEAYMLENISKVLRKPITEIKAEGITIAELAELRKNNIEIEDIKPFVKIH
jgi:hypothetical protein